MNAPDNRVRLTCVQNSSIVVFPLLLSEDDVFNSQPALGVLAYHVPYLFSLLRISQDKVSMFNSLSFTHDIVVNDEMETELLCNDKRVCIIYCIRTFAPVTDYISPPVTYFESLT